MTKLFKLPTNEAIVLELENRFDHPAITLFRGRELVVIRDYFAKHQLPLITSVLDLGCGEGNIGSVLYNSISVGIDILPADLKKAKKSGIYKKLELVDARKMPFSNSTFDLVFSNSVIEHIDGIEKVISETSRVLKKGGKFIFTAPTSYFSEYLYENNIFTKLGMGSIAKVYVTKRNKQLNHYNLYDHRRWSRVLKKYGLVIKTYQYYLSKKDISLWDNICISLRLLSIIPPLHALMAKKASSAVDTLLSQRNNLDRGASLFVVATRG